MKAKRVFNTYETKEDYSLKEFWIGLVLWSLLGLTIGSIVGPIVGLSVLGGIFFGALLFLVVGYTMDTKTIDADEITGIYKTIGRNPMFNVTKTRVWLFFGFRRTGRVYDYTIGISTISIKKTPTADTDPRQFISAEFDIPDYTFDALAYETNSGKSDTEELLQKFQSNQFQAWARTQTLYELESDTDVKVAGKFLKTIKTHAKKYGVIIEGAIEVRDITSTSDPEREELGKQFYKEKVEDLKQLNFSKRVNYNYLASLARRINNKSDQDYIDQAKENLTEPTDYEVSVEAISLAERDFLNTDERALLYKEAYENEETRQGFVPKKRFEGLGNSNLLFDPNK